MIALSPVLLIASAGALLDRAQFPGGAGMDGKGARRWSASFVHQAGYWSHFDHRTGKSSWPLPATECCDELATFASEKRALSNAAPETGEVFLLWSPSKGRFVHTGIVLAAERFDVPGQEPARYECLTIEGNITPTGCVGGDRLARVRRMLVPGRGDRTIRWTELEERIVSTRRRVA